MLFKYSHQQLHVDTYT